MKVLVISQPVWSEENNSGNTLSNVFAGFDGTFANIYFSEGQPHNAICHTYYQVTDHMIIDHLLKHRPIGRRFETEGSEEKAESTGFEKSAKKHSNFYTGLARELAWKLCRVDNDSMYQFIEDFQPDVIYAPCYGNFRMLRIVRRIQEKTNLPYISYISDDLYSYKSDQNTPLKRLTQAMLRKSLRKTFSRIDLFYTMTQEQKEAYEPLYGKEMKLLRKSAVVPYKKHHPGSVLKILYAGGIYYGRDEILAEIAKVLREKNRGTKQYELHIYTGGELKADLKEILNDRENSFFEGSCSYEQLLKHYADCDIALHVESFDEKNADITKLSFSTKIIDCLQSGAPMLAICPSINAGFRYLQRENAAVCISDPSRISEGLDEIRMHYDLWQQRAYQCLEKNHNHDANVKQLEEDFEACIRMKKNH